VESRNERLSDPERIATRAVVERTPSLRHLVRKETLLSGFILAYAFVHPGGDNEPAGAIGLAPERGRYASDPENGLIWVCSD
jgi:hypothetical protein